LYVPYIARNEIDNIFSSWVLAILAVPCKGPKNMPLISSSVKVNIRGNFEVHSTASLHYHELWLARQEGWSRE
jgi:hypothetical protein